MQDLVQKMLQLDPNRRPTASQVLQHNWIQHRTALPTHRLPLQEASVIKVSNINDKGKTSKGELVKVNE